MKRRSEVELDRAGAGFPRPRVDQAERRWLTIILFVAALLRVYSLQTIPAGIHVDEAFNLLDALRVIEEGWRPVFLPDNAGRDVLYTYLQAPLLAALGDQIRVARLASALIGSASLLVFWWTLRELLGGAGLSSAAIRRVALSTTALAGASYWHLHFSRFGIRAILFPLVVSAAVWAWWRVLSATPASPDEVATPSEPSAPDDRHAGGRSNVVDPTSLGRPGRPLALLSIFLGLAFYTHPAGRGLWLLPLAHALFLLWRERDALPLKRALLGLAGALVVAAPLLVFWWRHPQTFYGHASDASVIGEGLPALFQNALKVLGMFSFAGDPAPWRNFDSLPVYGQRVPATLIAVLGLFGLVRLLRDSRAGRRYASLALLWLLVLIAPTLLTDAAPNFSRAIGIIPVAFLVPMLGWLEVLERVGFDARMLDSMPDGPRGRDRRPALELLDIVLVLVTLVFSAWFYFGIAQRDLTRAMAFDADKVALAEYVDEIQAENAIVYLSPAMARHPTVEYIAETELVGFDPRQGFVLRPGPVPVAHYAVLENEGEALEALRDRMTAQLERPGSKHLSADAGAREGGASASADEASDAAGSTAGDRPAGATTSDPPPLQLRRVETSIGLPDILVFEADRQQLYDPSATQRQPVAPFVFQPDDLLFARLFDAVAPPTVRAGEAITVTFYWLANVASDVPLTNAVQLVDEEGAGIAQADGRPIGGSYPSDRWKEGEIIVSDHRLTIPVDAAPGPATLRVGWYWPATEDEPLRPMTTVAGESVVPAAEIEILPRP